MATTSATHSGQSHTRSTSLGSAISRPQLARALKGLTLVGGALLLWVYPQIRPGDTYNKFLLSAIAVYIIVAIGLNLLTGYSAQISLGQGAFFAVGAYTCAVLMVRFHWNFWLAVLGAALVSMALGFLLGLPALRLTGPYLAIVTLALAIAIPQLLLGWDKLMAWLNPLLFFVGAFLIFAFLYLRVVRPVLRRRYALSAREVAAGGGRAQARMRAWIAVGYGVAAALISVGLYLVLGAAHWLPEPTLKDWGTWTGGSQGVKFEKTAVGPGGGARDILTLERPSADLLNAIATLAAVVGVVALAAAVALTVMSVLQRRQGRAAGGRGGGAYGAWVVAGLGLVSYWQLPARLTHDQWMLYVALGLMGVMSLLAYNLLRTRVGRAFLAIRDSEVAGQAMGVNLAYYKTLAFGLSALFTGVAGALNAVLVEFISPDSFRIDLSIEFLTLIVIGGLGSLLGSLLGAGFVKVLPSFTGTIKGAPQAVYGLVLILIMIFMPFGLNGFVRPTWLAVWEDFASGLERSPWRKALVGLGATGALVALFFAAPKLFDDLPALIVTLVGLAVWGGGVAFLLGGGVLRSGVIGLTSLVVLYSALTADKAMVQVTVAFLLLTAWAWASNRFATSPATRGLGGRAATAWALAIYLAPLALYLLRDWALLLPAVGPVRPFLYPSFQPGLAREEDLLAVGIALGGAGIMAGRVLSETLRRERPVRRALAWALGVAAALLVSYALADYALGAQPAPALILWAPLGFALVGLPSLRAGVGFVGLAGLTLAFVPGELRLYAWVLQLLGLLAAVAYDLTTRQPAGQIEPTARPAAPPPPADVTVPF